MIEDEMAGWHHRLDGHGCGWTRGVGDGQGGLACCNSWGRSGSDTTERLNWNWNHRKILNHPFRVSLKLFKGLQRFIGAFGISLGLMVGQG